MACFVEISIDNKSHMINFDLVSSFYEKDGRTEILWADVAVRRESVDDFTTGRFMIDDEYEGLFEKVELVQAGKHDYDLTKYKSIR